jgi:hypothetical protein
MIIVSDTSPLNGLAIVGYLSLLPQIQETGFLAASLS